jgi:hypothetical protein
MPPGRNRYTEIYAPLREQAVNLQNQFHDFTGGNFADPKAHTIHHEIQRLVQDIDERREPMGIDYRIKAIQNQLAESKNAPQTFMNREHYDYMHRNYEHMRQGLHKFE